MCKEYKMKYNNMKKIINFESNHLLIKILDIKKFYWKLKSQAILLSFSLFHYLSISFEIEKNTNTIIISEFLKAAHLYELLGCKIVGTTNIPALMFISHDF